MKKTPFDILYENTPYSSELDYQLWDIDICDDPEMLCWKEKSFKEVISAVEEIASRYTIGSGWVQAEGIEEGCESSKKELKELRAVIRHMKRVYKKES